MNANTYDATPMHEEVISTSWKPRVFDDGTADEFEDGMSRWVEVVKDKFVPAMKSETIAQAIAYYERTGEATSLAELNQDYALVDVTHLYL